MWIKVAVLGGSGIVFSNLAVWTMAGLGIKIAFHSSREWVNSVVEREEKANDTDRLPVEEKGNEIEGLPNEEKANDTDRLPDEEKGNEIDRLLDEEKGNETDRLLDEGKGNGIDRLPDDILGDIVSRLRLIEASRTSILSKRWRNVWTTKSDFDFTCVSTFDIGNKYHSQVANNGDKQRFFKAVDQCLQLYSDRGRNCKLTRFSLHCCFLNGHTCHLVRWMQTLAMLDVERLDVGDLCWLKREKEYTFSFKLIDGLSRLKHIRLMNWNVETSFVGECNTLTRIDLFLLILLSHQLYDILMSCPNLGTLCLQRCELPLNLRISGPDLKLNFVDITFCSNVEKIEISDINVKTVFIDISRQVEISLSSLPKIEELFLTAPGINYCFGDVTLTRDLPELQLLQIESPYQILGLPPTIRAFRNIRLLCILAYGNKPFPEGWEKVDLWNFAPVLVSCPFLERFYLAIRGPVCKEERRNAVEWPVVRHKHLLFMELSGFTNTQNELEFSRFILTSAPVLQWLKLEVCLRRSDYGKGFHIDEDGKDSKQIDARVAKQIDALSLLAQVELL